MPPKKRKQPTQPAGVSKKAKQTGSTSSQGEGPSTSAGAGSSPPLAVVWCRDCNAASTAACRSEHACTDTRTARVEAEGRLRAVQGTLHKLAALEAELGVKLTAQATLRGEGGEEEGLIGITLAVPSLSDAERAAVLDLLEGLETFPEEEYMASGGCSVLKTEPMRALRARLPTHGPGVTLKAGAILLAGDAPSAPSSHRDEEDSEEYNQDESSEGRWTGNDVRIYYDQPVKPSQAIGAKILGYISSNLQLIGNGKPGGEYHLPGWGARYDEGMGVDLQDVKFV